MTVKIKSPGRFSRYAPILGGDLDEQNAVAACVAAVATVKDLPAIRQTRVVEAAVATLVRVAACHVCEIRLGDGSGHQNAPYANTCAALSFNRPPKKVPSDDCITLI